MKSLSTNTTCITLLRPPQCYAAFLGIHNRLTDRILSQICRLSFAIINSTTIHLLAWRKACHSHQLNNCIIPRDVPTHWDSTYNMLVFAIEYRAAIDGLTSNHTAGLHAHELNNTNWHIVKDLWDMLKVCSSC